MTAIRTIGILFASLALTAVADAQKGGGKPGGGVKTVTVFAEEFNYGFSEGWTTDGTLHPLIGSDDSGFVITEAGGSPVIQFRQDGQSLRLNTKAAASGTTYGFVSTKTLSSIYEVEARFNTLTQDQSNIDGLFHLYLVNATDPSKFVGIYPYAGCFAECRGVWVHSTSARASISSSFENNKWYRFVIRDDPTSGLVAKWLSDDGTTELGSYSFGIRLADLGATFRVGFGQHMGIPDLTNNLESAVDYLRVKALR